jgi:tRNA nucleotidyltransferase (CCA-adding enzyme)
LKPIEEFCSELRVPTEYKKIAKGICRYHMHMHKLDVMKPLTFVRMFENLKAYHNPEIIDLLHMVGCADHRGRLGNENSDVSHLDTLKKYFNASKDVKFMDAVKEHTKGNKIPEGEQARQLMEKARTIKISEFKKEIQNPGPKI